MGHDKCWRIKIWRFFTENLGEATGEVDDSDESTTEAED